MRIIEDRWETILTSAGSYKTPTFVCSDDRERGINEIVKRFRCADCGGWLNWIDGAVQCQDCGAREFVHKNAVGSADEAVDILDGLPEALRDAALANARTVERKDAPMFPIIIKQSVVIDDDYDPDSAERFLRERDLLKVERS